MPWRASFSAEAPPLVVVAEVLDDGHGGLKIRGALLETFAIVVPGGGAPFFSKGGGTVVGKDGEVVGDVDADAGMFDMERSH